MARKFLSELLTHKEVRALLSDEHLSVDGTQVQAWASMKSFVAKDGSSEPPSSGRNSERDFHGEKRRNETHAGWFGKEDDASPKFKKTQQFGAIFSGLLGERTQLWQSRLRLTATSPIERCETIAAAALSVRERRHSP